MSSTTDPDPDEGAQYCVCVRDQELQERGRERAILSQRDQPRGLSATPELLSPG